MVNSPEVSIIIPSLFDKPREKFLVNTITSIKYQTFKNYEIILVNLNKNPALKKKLRIINNKLRYFKTNVPNPGKARTLGMDKSRGNYIAFLDDDDLWDPCFLETALNNLKLKKDADLIIYNYEAIDENGKHLYYLFQDKVIDEKNILKTQIINNIFTTNSILFKKKISRVVRPKFGLAETTYFGLFCAAHGFKIILAREPLVKYLVHSDSDYHNKKHELQTYINSIITWEEFIRKYPAVYPALVKKRLSRQYANFASYYLVNTQFVQAKEYAIKSFKTKMNLNALRLILKIVFINASLPN